MEVNVDLSVVIPCDDHCRGLDAQRGQRTTTNWATKDYSPNVRVAYTSAL